jgi:hypothetical protein
MVPLAKNIGRRLGGTSGEASQWIEWLIACGSCIFSIYFKFSTRNRSDKLRIYPKT